MSDFLPDGEGVRRAIKWISEMRSKDPAETLKQLIDDASRKFDLNPLEEEFLWKTLGGKKD